MKTILIALSLFSSLLVHADSYYCELKNVPSVKTALEQALLLVESAEMGVPLDGTVLQFGISGMGDAFDYWGTDMLVFGLDGLAKDLRHSVGVRVTYNAFMAKEYVGDGSTGESYTCSDTGELNPEKLFIDGEAPISATPVLF